MASGRPPTRARGSQDRQVAVAFSHVSAVACLGGLEDPTFQNLACTLKLGCRIHCGRFRELLSLSIDDS